MVYLYYKDDSNLPLGKSLCIVLIQKPNATVLKSDE